MNDETFAALWITEVPKVVAEHQRQLAEIRRMRMSKWIKCSESLPEPLVEVLVEVNGHRGPLWRNNHNLVAYMDEAKAFREERHPLKALVGVTHWMPLPPAPDEVK